MYSNSIQLTIKELSENLSNIRLMSFSLDQPVTKNEIRTPSINFYVVVAIKKTRGPTVSYLFYFDNNVKVNKYLEFGF